MGYVSSCGPEFSSFFEPEPLYPIYVQFEFKVERLVYMVVKEEESNLHILWERTVNNPPNRLLCYRPFLFLNQYFIYFTCYWQENGEEKNLTFKCGARDCFTQRVVFT